MDKQPLIGVIGLGYVGLPLALAFAEKHQVIGYDKDIARIEMMQNSVDPSRELPPSSFENKTITFSANKADLNHVNVYIVSVPTDIDAHQVPDLSPLLNSSETIGKTLKKNDIVVYESTVYPGCTEEDCIPVLEASSQLKANEDFYFGYSPERIVPGNSEKGLRNIVKVVSASNQESLDFIAKLYETIIEAGVYKAPSIKVAEASKVLENTQRDLNISLMNEMSIIFDRLGISTKEVIEAASTKWNFQAYQPGLVGGHCISVDPFYLLHKSKELGYDPQVIAAGRRINDMMPEFVAKKMVQVLLDHDKNISECKVLVKGIAFKENVADIRNSKSLDLVRELERYSLDVDVQDPKADSAEVFSETGIQLLQKLDKNYDAIIVAVRHQSYLGLNLDYFNSISKSPLILFDLKSIYNKAKDMEYIHWSL